MKRHLSVGCGKLHEKSTDEIEWINLDKAAEVSPDVIRDLSRGIPFNSEWFDHVKAFACLGQIERNDDFLFVMNEFHRVIKPEGTLWVYIPHRDYPHCYLDPFNQRRTNELHWEGFDENSAQYTQHNHYYGFKPWKNVRVNTENGFVSAWLTKSIEK